MSQIKFIGFHLVFLLGSTKVNGWDKSKIGMVKHISVCSIDEKSHKLTSELLIKNPKFVDSVLEPLTVNKDISNKALVENGPYLLLLDKLYSPIMVVSTNLVGCLLEFEFSQEKSGDITLGKKIDHSPQIRSFSWDSNHWKAILQLYQLSVD